MRQHESRSASKYSCAFADACVSFFRCRSSAQSSVRSARLSSVIGAFHTLHSPAAGWHRPLAAARACRLNAADLSWAWRFLHPVREPHHQAIGFNRRTHGVIDERGTMGDMRLDDLMNCSKCYGLAVRIILSVAFGYIPSTVGGG